MPTPLQSLNVNIRPGTPGSAHQGYEVNTRGGHRIYMALDSAQQSTMAATLSRLNPGTKVDADQVSFQRLINIAGITDLWNKAHNAAFYSVRMPSGQANDVKELALICQGDQALGWMAELKTFHKVVVAIDGSEAVVLRRQSNSGAGIAGL